MVVVCAVAMPMEIGVLPLPQDFVSQGLDARALTLLCPPPLGSPLSVSFHPCERESGVAMSQELSFWGCSATWVHAFRDVVIKCFTVASVGAYH